MLKKVVNLTRQWFKPNSKATMFPLTPLSLPEGITEQQLFNFITSVRVQDAPEAEMIAYRTQDFLPFCIYMEMS